MKYKDDITLLKYACEYASSHKALAKLLFNSDSRQAAQKIADWKTKKKFPFEYKVRFAALLKDAELLASLINRAAKK